MNKKILIVGDEFGVPQLMRYLPAENVAGIVCAGLRHGAADLVRPLAVASNVPLVVQPKYKSDDYPEFVEAVKNTNADVLLVNSYSMIIRDEILEIFNGEAYNIHYALLPRNRGANSVQWAIIHGDKKTGITMHKLSSVVDAGDIALQIEADIDENDTWLSLRDRLRYMSEDFVKSSIEILLSGDINLTAQDDNEALTNKRLDEDYPEIDFGVMTDKQIYDLIRAQVSPLKGAYVTTAEGRRHFPEMLTLSEVSELRNRYSA